jgi:hypothetical protein
MTKMLTLQGTAREITSILTLPTGRTGPHWWENRSLSAASLKSHINGRSYFRTTVELVQAALDELAANGRIGVTPELDLFGHPVYVLRARAA